MLRSKSEAYTAFYALKQQAENHKGNKRIAILATDNGTEYINHQFKRLITDRGIIHQNSAPYTPEQMGVIEIITKLS